MWNERGFCTIIGAATSGARGGTLVFMRDESSQSFDPSTFGPIFGPLVAAAPLNPLGAGRPDSAATRTLGELPLAEAFAPGKIVDQEMAEACVAGLWLMYDDLDRSHTISQSIETPTGSYWHAIMHRREGDFGNSKYWFHRVGKHRIFGGLAEAARELAREHLCGGELEPNTEWLAGGDDWDPFRFVDLCAAAVRGHSSAERLCRLVQQRECQLLFAFCYQHAIEL